MIKFIEVRSHYRGHEIKLDDSSLEDKTITLLEYNKKFGIPNWIYCDTLKLADDSRPCKKCGIVIKQNTPDACLGYLEGVSGACCGHGIENRKYVNIPHPEGGTCNLRGEDYYLFMKDKIKK